MEAIISTIFNFLVSQEDLKLPIFTVTVMFAQMYLLKRLFIEKNDRKNKK
jgi:hypothetical protein